MILFQHLMVRSPVILCVPSIPSSSHPLTVMYPDWFPRGLVFETFHGFLKIWSGHLVVWLHHIEKHRQVVGCRYVSIGCIRTRRVAKDGNGGHSRDWCWGDDRFRPLRPGRRRVEAVRAMFIFHIINNILNFRRVFMARPVLLRTRRRDSPSLNKAISSPYCIK